MIAARILIIFGFLGFILWVEKINWKIAIMREKSKWVMETSTKKEMRQYHGRIRRIIQMLAACIIGVMLRDLIFILK
jgi:hypothetical protein